MKFEEALKTTNYAMGKKWHWPKAMEGESEEQYKKRYCMCTNRNGSINICNMESHGGRCSYYGFKRTEITGHMWAWVSGLVKKQEACSEIAEEYIKIAEDYECVLSD